MQKNEKASHRLPFNVLLAFTLPTKVKTGRKTKKSKKRKAAEEDLNSSGQFHHTEGETISVELLKGPVVQVMRGRKWIRTELCWMKTEQTDSLKLKKKTFLSPFF